MTRVTCLLPAFLLLGACAAGASDDQKRDTSWLRNARYGVFVHYLGGGDDWNERVNSFDVERFAEQIARTGAAYLVFTLGQNSGARHGTCRWRSPTRWPAKGFG